MTQQFCRCSLTFTFVYYCVLCGCVCACVCVFVSLATGAFTSCSNPNRINASEFTFLVSHTHIDKHSCRSWRLASGAAVSWHAGAVGAAQSWEVCYGKLKGSRSMTRVWLIDTEDLELTCKHDLKKKKKILCPFSSVDVHCFLYKMREGAESWKWEELKWVGLRSLFVLVSSVAL